MRTRLPNCQFVKYTPVPKGTQNVIQTGMSKEQLIETVVTLIYDPRADRPDKKAPTVQLLGSQMNVNYSNSSGNETWMYFTDGVGIGGIDFDANQRVSEVWSTRGILSSRELTPNAPPVVGSGWNYNSRHNNRLNRGRHRWRFWKWIIANGDAVNLAVRRILECGF